MTDYNKYLALDARLVILKELIRQTDGRLNETILRQVLDAFGHRRSREWLRTQLRHLAELEVIKITEVGSVMIASLTQLGIDHVERRALVEGIARPSPEA